MLQAFVIVLREGFEAFLIVAIALAYLRRTGREALAPAVFAGIVTAVGASAGLGIVLMRGAASRPLLEAVLGFLALPLVVGLVVHMARVGPRLRGSIETRIEASASRPRASAAAGVFLFTVLMISREGMETAVLLFQVREGWMLGGAVLGLLGAGLMGWLWASVGHTIDLRRFFRVTGVFLVLFAIQIAVASFHELAETGLLPNSVAIHVATEPYGPEGVYGRWLTFGMVAVPAVWLAFAWLLERRRWSGGRSSAA